MTYLVISSTSTRIPSPPRHSVDRGWGAGLGGGVDAKQSLPYLVKGRSYSSTSPTTFTRAHKGFLHQLRLTRDDHIPFFGCQTNKHTMKCLRSQPWSMTRLRKQESKSPTG